jgi:hypothetical protein
VAGLNAFETVGAASTVSVAVLLPAPTVGVCVVVTPEVVLFCEPGVLLVTLNVTVQLLLAGMLIPLKLSEVAPADKLVGLVPVQLPPTLPPAAVMLLSASVNVAPDSAVALLLDRVSVTVDVPPA